MSHIWKSDLKPVCIQLNICQKIVGEIYLEKKYTIFSTLYGTLKSFNSFQKNECTWRSVKMYLFYYKLQTRLGLIVCILMQQVCSGIGLLWGLAYIATV